MDIMTIFYGIIVIFGGYMVVSAFGMRKKGEINKTIINQEELVNCKDKQGFIDFIYWKEAVLGGVFCAMGILGILNNIVFEAKVVSMIELVIFLGSFLWFQNELGKARKKFF